MKELTIKLFTYSELSDSAKEYAYTNSRYDFSDCYSSEYRATLAAFEKIFDIKVTNWEVGGYRPHSFDFNINYPASEAPEGDPLRLTKYVINNYAHYITKGKYYSTPGKYINGRYTYKYRHSNIIVQNDCPLTGVCMDHDILDPVYDCITYKRFFSSYEDLITDCLYHFFKAWEAELEYLDSQEYFAEFCQNNDVYFTIDGNEWRA